MTSTVLTGPSGQTPTYLDSVIASPESYNNTSNWWNAYDENTQMISDMYREISRGKIHVLGKAFSVVLSRQANQYSDDSLINLEIWDSLKAKIPDWKPYDLWQKGTDGKFRYEGDNFVDMIFKVHKSRAPVMYPADGYAQLGLGQSDYKVDDDDTIYVRHDHSDSGSGLTVSFNATRSQYIGTIKHELCHFTIATGGHYTYSAVNYGIGGDGFYSPYDMILSRYMVPQTFNYSSQTSFSLEDYSSRYTDTIGNILKLPIQDDEYFLIVSRRKISKWDRVMLGDTVLKIGYYNDNTEYGKGIYIYHVENGISHPTSDFSPQDMECADGYYKWDSLPVGRHYQNVPTTCFQSSPHWPYFNKKYPLYTNDKSIVASYNPVGDGVSFNYRSCSSGTGCDSAWPKWWGIGEQEENSNPCLVGKDGIYTNKTEIYTAVSTGGDRWDCWNVGYNEIFSPYSSPSTCDWNSEVTGIFVWNDALSGSTASLKIYRASENGGSTSLETILELTPPSRPMGLEISEVYPPNSPYCHPVLTWKHNLEPDMVRENGLLKYKIYRAVRSNMSSVPYSYDYLATVDKQFTSPAVYIDNSVTLYDCSFYDHPPSGTPYPVRYYIKAVDKYNFESVPSDFVQEVGVAGEIEEADNMSINSNLPKEYELKQNFPNPFNPSTNIQYDLPKDNFVTIKIYDLLGKEVLTLVNEAKTAGSYIISFNASNLSSGIYYYKIKAGTFEQVRKMILLK